MDTVCDGAITNLSVVPTIFAAPCTNRCGHCWAFGRADTGFMKFEDIVFVLEQLADVSRAGNNVMPLFFYEPTIHPDFLKIIKKLDELKLLSKELFLATNGSGLGRWSQDDWLFYKETGFGYFQLTFYGLEEAHDRFASRKGAYKDLMRTIEQANKYGIGWYASVLILKENIAVLPELIAHLKALGADPAGAFRPVWQGRATELESIEASDFDVLPERQRQRLLANAKTEGQIIEEALKDPEAGSRPAHRECGLTTVEIYPDFSVYTSGACETGGLKSVLPEFKEEFKLGNLKHESLKDILQAYVTSPPRILKILEQVTARELATRFGQSKSNALWRENELVCYKWASEYIRTLPARNTPLHR